MPKSQFIDPESLRARGQIEFASIPVNQYDRSVKDELSNYTAAELIGIQRDMEILRAFETMLNDVKMRGSYKGLEYTHSGPAHLSIGQEAAAVGQAFLLGVDDHIYGSHRSHGEILAKGLSAIRKSDERTLMEIMEGHFGGACLEVVAAGAGGDVNALAVDFLIYGALAEIFGRSTGFNRGMGGSMHAFFPPFGIYPNNAIVGGSGDIAVGAALFKKVNRRAGIVIANLGDASLGCGPVWEGICLATMDQYKELWEEPYRGGLPLIFNFVNNFYGMGGQPVGETMGFGMLARLGAGVNPQQMHAERVDGFSALAVIDCIRRKKEVIERGDGPVLLDTITYRFSGHSPSDAGAYRDRSEIEAWRKVDPLETYAAALVDAGVAETGRIDTLREDAEELVLKAFRKAVDPAISPREELTKTSCLLERTMFSNSRVEVMETGSEPEVLIPKDENPRLKQLAKRSRSGLDGNGNPLPKNRVIGIRDAIFEAVLDRFYADPTLIAYGEENRDWGGAFGVYRGLTEALGYHRLFNTPISEGAIVGSAVGYAMEGGRALVEIMYCDFLGRCGDEMFNQLAKWQAMSGGLMKMPVVVRVSVGATYGAQHSQDWTSFCAHVPGLKVVFPATPYDAKGLMYSALLGTDPVIFFESQRLYDQGEIFVAGGVPQAPYEVPIGVPALRRQGSDLTILTVGATLYRALEAADILEKQYGVSSEIIDARSLVPFDYGKVIESIEKTHRILLTSDACDRGSALHTLASRIAQFAFHELDSPPTVVGSKNWITPPADLEEAFFPHASDIIDAVHEHLMPLEGYTPTGRSSVDDLLRKSAEGI